MSSIDERVVEMKFDNSQFESGVKTTLSSLTNLKNALKMEGASSGLSSLSSAAANIPGLSQLANGVEAIGGKFKAMSVVAISALATISSKAVQVGLDLVKKFTIEPIMEGLSNYETKINAIQTILANTQAQGTTLTQITGALKQLNTYANQTVYNFADMAKNIGTFTAAGVDLKTSVSSIKGIANLAAMSGSTADQASSAMYQLSQAISSGYVKLQDWNSVVNAGIGGKTFQNALVATARANGIAVDAMIKKQGSFRQSLTEGWLTSKVLTETLSEFTGDLSDKQLEAMGFTQKEAEAIQKQAQTAVKSATQVRTLTQLMQDLSEEVGSAWSAVWEDLLGNITGVTKILSAAHVQLENFFTAPVYSLDTMLKEWDKLGGRTQIITAIGDSWKTLQSIITAVGKGFSEVFPPATGKDLLTISSAILSFAKALEPTSKDLNEIQRTAAGFFAALDIGWQVVKGLAGVIGDLVGQFTGFGGGLLSTSATLGDFLVKLDKAIKSGTGLQTFFSGMARVLALPIAAIKTLAGLLDSLFTGSDPSKALKPLEDALGALKQRFQPLVTIAETIAKVFGAVIDVFKDVYKFLQPVLDIFENTFANLGNAIASGVKNANYNSVFDAINAALSVGAIVIVKKFLDNISKAIKTKTGFLDQISEIFEGLTNSLKAMQSTLKAATLLELAVAIGLLTGSVAVLATINSEALTKSLGAITVMFTDLLTAMGIFQKITDSKGFVKMPVLAAGLILIAGAITLLAGAVKLMAGLDWNGLAKGLTGVTGLVIILSGAVKTMSGQSGGMITTAAGLVLLAGAIKLLADSVTDLSGLSWSEMAKGITGVAALLTALDLFTHLSNTDKGGVLQGAGLILLATGISIMAKAVGAIGKLSWSEIAKGLVGMAGGLAEMATALSLMPPESILSAAAILITASAIGMIAKALQSLGGMSWSEIAKSLVELGGALTLLAAGLAVMTEGLPGAAALIVAAGALAIMVPALQAFGQLSWSAIGKDMVVLFGALTLLAAAMIAMTEGLPGAAAMLVMAAALTVLTPVIQAMGELSWGEIAKSMATLAGVFAIFGAAGALLTPVVPTLLALGAAVVLMGAGMALAGVGIGAFAAGLAALAVSGAAGAAAIVSIVDTVSSTIPTVAKNLAKGILDFASTLAAGSGQFVKAATALLDAVIQAINNVGPKIITTLANLADKLVTAIANHAPSMANAGLKIITALMNALNSHITQIVNIAASIITKFLDGIADHEGQIVTAGTNIIIKFLDGIDNNMGRIADAGAKTAVSFVNSVASAIRNNSGAMGAAGGNLASALIEGMVNGISGGIGSIIGAAENMAQSALNAAKKALGVHSPSKEFEKIGQFVNQGFAKGIRGPSSASVDKAFSDLRSQVSTSISDAKSNAKDAQTALDNLTKSRSKNTKAIAQATQALKEANAEVKTETTVQNDLLGHIKDEKTKLDALSKSYDNYTTKINTAKQALAAAKQTRDDYNSSLQSQFDSIESIGSDTTYSSFTDDLKTQVSNLALFSQQIQKLRKEGLNDTLYKQLLAAGPDALPFMSQLEDEGTAGVSKLNQLSNKLAAESKSLGTTASNSLYQAGVNAAQGVVNGLQKQQAAITKQMDKIADSMVNEIKKKLKIHSPSQVFQEIGQYANQGMANGLDKYSTLVSDSASKVGETAITSMQNSISKISDTVASNMNVQPTISPVLDLSNVTKAASTIKDLIPKQTIDLDAAYNKASYLSNRQNGTDVDGNPLQSTGKTVNQTFNQYNNSPKSLSSVEIYRQTKNQLTTAKRSG